MNSLRGRIIALTALVALLSTAICALAASRSALHGLESQEDQQAHGALTGFRQRLEQVLASLAYEVSDYSRTSGLAAQLPVPRAEWAAANLTPLRHPGAVARVLLCAENGQVRARFSAVDQRDQPSPEREAVEAAALAQLLGSGVADSGLAVIAGMPVLYALVPVPHGDGAAAKHELLGLAYFDEQVRERLRLPGWELTVSNAASHPAPVGTAAQFGEPEITRAGNQLMVAVTVDVRGGAFAVALRGSRQAGQLLGVQTQLAIFTAGLATVLIALLCGTVMAWYWLRPLVTLVDACRRRAEDPSHPIPDASGLTEADVLAEALQRLVDAERAGREALAQALERETTANAVHQRFLAQLAHEFGQPIRTLINTVDLLHGQGGRVDPVVLAASRQAALQLEERFQEVLGLAAEYVAAEPGSPNLSLRDYLGGVAELLRPVAERRGLALTVAADDGSLPIDARLLTPILVNLAANAFKATASGSVTLAVHLDAADRTSVWTVADSGSGIAAEQAARIAAACQRGEVLPGEPGLGLGLALALANTRALGGRLRLAANGAGGAAFELRLPHKAETARWKRSEVGKKTMLRQA